MGEKPHEKPLKNDGWVFVEATYGMYAERGAERHRLCSTRVHREKALKLFREFVEMNVGSRDQE